MARIALEEFRNARLWHAHHDADGVGADYTAPPTADWTNGLVDPAVTIGPLTIAEEADPGVYVADFRAYDPADYEVGNWYEVAWSGQATGDSVPEVYAREPLEVVSRRLFSLGDLRAFSPELLDADVYSTRALEAIRTAVEQRFERVMRRSYLGAGRLEVLFGSGTDTLEVKERDIVRVVAAWVNGTVLTDTLTPSRNGFLYTGGTWEASTTGAPNVVVAYSYGVNETPANSLSATNPVPFGGVPGALKAAGLVYARHLLLTTAVESSNRATAVFTDVGGFRLSIAGRDGPTGLPEVDAVLMQYGYMKPGAFA